MSSIILWISIVCMFQVLLRSVMAQIALTTHANSGLSTDDIPHYTRRTGSQIPPECRQNSGLGKLERNADVNKIPEYASTKVEPNHCSCNVMMPL